MKLRYKKLEGYKPVESIGKGGQGEVLKVIDPTGRRTYALKLLNRSSDLRLFEREIKALQSLNHSNIVNIYDAGFEEEEGGYILMEYMKHGNLTDYLKNYKEVSIPERLILIQDVARALKYIHDEEFIHRDIKPHNIFITDDGNEPYGCLGDFGIVKMLGEETLTKTGAGVGTMLYLPPEVLDGSEKVSKYTDLYALGMSLYEAITGELAYNTTPLIFMQELMGKQPIAPSQKNQLLPKELDQICLKSIAKEKKVRYQSIEEFIEDLEKCIAIYSDKSSEGMIHYTSLFRNEEIIDFKLYLQAKQDKQFQKEMNFIKSANKKASKAKSDMKIYDLGLDYWYGYTKKQDHDMGKKIFKQAAKRGVPEAISALGEIYYQGIVEKKDEYQALILFEHAAIMGDGVAKYYIAKMYEDGNIIKSNKEKEKKYYEEAKEILSKSYTEFNKRRESPKGFEFIDSKAITILGNLYFEENTADSNSKAYNCYLHASGYGRNSDAMFSLGKMYTRVFSPGIEASLSQAIHWYTKAAEINHRMAMSQLGDLYVNWHFYDIPRDGFQLDLKKSQRNGFAWYTKAAELGDPEAMYELGCIYEKGQGVEANQEKSGEWYTKAAELGNFMAIERLMEMEKESKDDGN